MGKEKTKPATQPGGIKKQDFSGLKQITNKYSSVAKYKPQEYFTVDEAFYEASGLPGPGKGHINMLLGHSDTGKSQPLSSKILTPTGWKLMGDIQIGDIIMDTDGTTQQVLNIFPQGIRPVYKVTMKDGGVTYCDEEHLWTVYIDHENGDVQRAGMTTKDILNHFDDYEYRLPVYTPMTINTEDDWYIDYLKFDDTERYIKSIEYDRDEECQCILVSNPNHLYITDDYIVTHNTTAMVKSAVSVQKNGGIPVFIITEQKWSWEHAKIMGLEFNENVDPATGEIDYDGQFIFNNNFKSIEDISEYINGMLDEQEKGNIPYELTFLWDSIGSVPCRMTLAGKGGKMHNAGVLADVIGMGLNSRITGSRTVNSKYTNTLIIVNQPWVKTDMKNPMSQPKIKAKGGEAVYLNSTLVFQFGNQQDSGISRIDATRNGRKIVFATRSKVSVIKNHINGLGYADGRLICTPHGFIKDTPEDIKKYKTDHSDYWQIMLGDSDFDLVESEVVNAVTTQGDEE